MKKLFRSNTKKLRLAELSEVAIEEAEATQLSGGFKEYKTAIYDTEKHSKVRIQISQLFGSMEELVP